MKLLNRRPDTRGIPEVLASSEASSTEFVRQTDPDELNRLVAVARVLDIDPGQEVVAEGSLSHHCVFVLDGVLDVVRDGEIVADVAPGWFGGEMSIRHRRRRNATLVARTTGRVLAIGRGEFDRLLATCPSIRAHVDATIEDRASRSA